MADATSKLNIIISASASKATTVLRSLKSTLGSVVSGIGSLLTSWKAWLTGIVSLGAIVALGKQFISLGADMETSRLQLQTLMGSVAQGNKLFAEMTTFANVTPFDTAEIVQAGKSLKSFGIEGGKVVPTLKLLGNASAVSGKSLVELSSIYGKVMAKGKVETEALNQFQEAGIPILKALAKQYGVNKEAIYKMASEGKITAQSIEGAFNAMSAKGGEFAGAMDKLSKTTNGLMSTLQGNISTMIATVSEQLQPVVQKCLTMIIDYLDTFSAKVSDGTIAEAILGIAAGALETIAYVGEGINSLAAVLMTVYDVAVGVAGNVYDAVKSVNDALFTSTEKSAFGLIDKVFGVTKSLYDTMTGLIKVARGVLLGQITLISQYIVSQIDGILSAWNYLMRRIGRESAQVGLLKDSAWGQWNDLMEQDTQKQFSEGSSDLASAFTGKSFNDGQKNGLSSIGEDIRSVLKDVSGVDVSAAYAQNRDKASAFSGPLLDGIKSLAAFTRDQQSTIKDTVAAATAAADAVEYTKEAQETQQTASKSPNIAGDTGPGKVISDALRAIGGYGLGMAIESPSDKKRNRLLTKMVALTEDIKAANRGTIARLV